MNNLTSMKTIKLFYIVVPLVICCLTGAKSLYGDELPSDAYKLTLKEAVSLAIENNLDIQIAGFNPQIRKAEVRAAKGEFDASVGLELHNNYRENQTSSELSGTPIAVNRKKQLMPTFGQKTKTGMTYLLEWNTYRNDTNSAFVTKDPHYDSQLLFKIKQPLLEGRGKTVQESNINIGKNNYQVAALELESETHTVIADVEKDYWDLYHAYDQHEVSLFSLRLAQQLKEVSEARIQAGVLAPIEIYQSEAEIAKREEELLNSEKSIKDFDDRLKEKMRYENWNIEFIPSDAPPEPAKTPPSSEQEVAEAMLARNDYKQALLDLENKKISVAVAKNKVLPDLSLEAEIGVSGLDENFQNTYEDEFSTNYYSYGFGLLLNVPIKNRTDKSNLIKAKAQRRQSATNIERVKQRIVVEVREAVRAVELAMKKIQATIKSEALAKKRLENEEEKFKLGMSTATDVLQIQESYIQELEKKKLAATDYAKALAELRLVKRVSRSAATTTKPFVSSQEPPVTKTSGTDPKSLVKPPPSSIF